MPERCKPKFRVGNVVVWCHQYYAVKDVLPLHCQGAAQRYTISPVVVGEEEFASPERGVEVSEGVLRHLTRREMDLPPRQKARKPLCVTAVKTKRL